MKKYLILLAVIFVTAILFAQDVTLYLHDFGSTAISTHPYTVAPGTFAANLSSSSWVNSIGAWTSFAGSAGQAIALTQTSASSTITLTFSVATGYQLSVSQFNFWRRRSTTGPANWSMSINGISVGNGVTSTTGAAVGVTSVSNAVSNKTGTITVVLSLSNGASSGTFRLDDFQLIGTVSAAGGSTITTGTISTPPFYVDSATSASGTVAFSSTGTFSSGTTFTAYLSDASGSFASPTNIGYTTVSGTDPSGNISITIPIGTAEGAGYKIRIDCSSPTITGSESALFTIQNGAKNLTGVISSVDSGTLTVSWTDPTTIYDEIMIVAKATSSITASPTGNGSGYSASLMFGSGTGFDGGYVVYKGNSSPQTITNLTNGTLYYVKLFTRKNSNWSTGVEISNTPTISGVQISAGNAISESFSIGATQTASLPTWWKVDKNTTARLVGTYSAAGTATEQFYGNEMSSTAANGICNYGAGVYNSASDRAVGWLSSSSATKSGNLYVKLYNNGTTNLQYFTISYNVEKYRNGSNAEGFSIQMYYSTDGSTWTNAGTDFLTSFSANTDNSGFTTAPGATSSVSNKTLSVSIAASSSLYLAWNYSVTSGSTTSNAQALSIDDVSITADDENTPVELSSFTATLSAQNYVNLTWVTQTETGMIGYYVYRAVSDDLSSAQIVSPMIDATNTSMQQTYIFTDSDLNDSGTYYYWLQSMDFDGSNVYHGPTSLYYSTTGDDPTPEIPLTTELKSVYPNPFNPQTFIPFSVASSSDVNFKIYNSRGQIVKQFALGTKVPGNYRIEWNGTDSNGQILANGVYYIKMFAGKDSFQRKAVLLK